jgi:hypothetical protein
MIKIISGYTGKGGSTVAFINLTNYFNSIGLDCVLYGNHDWHLDKCRSAKLSGFKTEPDDRIISHFLELQNRPNVHKIVLGCHEKWWFKVGQIKQYWDEVIFLHEAHKDYHVENGYHGQYSIIPNLKESLTALPIDQKQELDLVAGIIGSIEDRKKTHISILKALKDRCQKVYIYGNILDEGYFNKEVKPLLGDRVQLIGFSENKQQMYDSIGRVYHSSVGEVACLVKDECYLTNTKFFGNEETNHEVSPLPNNQIINLWLRALDI